MPERYYKELLAFFTRSTGDRERAADIVQESYTRVLTRQGAASGTPESEVRDPRALLYQTGKNLVIDQHRRDEVRQLESLSDSEEGLQVADAVTSQPDAQASRKQEMLRLLAAIESLPPRCREAFILFKFDELPQAEIAERMCISRNMVEKHIIAGMVACRRALGETTRN